MMMWWLTACVHEPFSDCGSTEEPSICLMEAVQRSQGELADVVSQCQEASLSENLKGECFFLISDERGLIGDSARDICQHATPFVEDCLRHAAARDVEQTIFAMVQQASPQPMKLLPRIHGVVRQYLEPQVAESMSRDMVLRFQASRVETTFQPSDCQGLQPNLCSQVYLLASLGSREQWSGNYQEPWMTKCSEPLQQEIAKQWGWKRWSEPMDSAVQQAYQQICQALPAAKSDSSK